jgi:hypothetical protein
VAAKQQIVSVTTPGDGLDVRAGDIIPGLAVDRSTGARRGSLYLVWQDGQFSATGSSAIAFSRSANEGKTWSPPFGSMTREGRRRSTRLSTSTRPGASRSLGPDGGRILIPIVCLIEAARHVGDDMPRLLVDHPACEVAPLTAIYGGQPRPAYGYSAVWTWPSRCWRPPWATAMY